MAFAPNDSSLSSTKTPISFWCKRELNSKFLIQPSDTLIVKLTETHRSHVYLTFINHDNSYNAH